MLISNIICPSSIRNTSGNEWLACSHVLHGYTHFFSVSYQTGCLTNISLLSKQLLIKFECVELIINHRHVATWISAYTISYAYKPQLYIWNEWFDDFVAMFFFTKTPGSKSVGNKSVFLLFSHGSNAEDWFISVLLTTWERGFGHFQTIAKLYFSKPTGTSIQSVSLWLGPCILAFFGTGGPSVLEGLISTS